MKNNYITLFAFFGVSMLIFSSCNAVKYVDDGEHLLTKNTIKVNDKKNIDNEVSDYIIQRPNSKALGIPISLNFYNLGNKNYEISYEKWKDSFPKKENFMRSVFSEKQSRKFRESKYNFNQWFFKNGDEPVILDSIKSQQTAEKLQKHFRNQGYFRAKVDFEESFKKEKHGTVEYNIDTDKVYHIDSVSRNIKTPILDSIFELHKSETLIVTGKEFKDSYFQEEADRITDLYRNSGVYHFTRNAIGFKGDSTLNSYKSDIKLNIENRIVSLNDSLYTTPFKIQTVSQIDIYTDYSFNRRDDPFNESEEYNGYTFYAHDNLKFKPRLLTNSIFIELDSLYNDVDRDLTRKNLRRLQNFRLVNIKYDEIDSTNLAAKIYLTPYKKYSFAIDTELTHSNIKQLGVSGRLSLLNRNTFRGAEILRFSVQGSFFNSTDAADTNQSFFNAWEFGGDVSLEIPRILFPINVDKLIPKSMSPNTRITLGTSFQKNIGLDKQKFTGIYGYNWESNKTNRHRLELFNGQFIKNLNVGSYFDIYRSEYDELVDISVIISETNTIPDDNYDDNGDLIPLTFIDYMLDPTNDFEDTNTTEYDETLNIDKRYDIITENVVVPLISYEFIFNNSEGFKDTNFSFFRARIASAGLLANTFANESDISGKKEILGVPVAQYLKLDLEYKKFWGIAENNVLAFRTFLGLAMPYGNSEDIPFSRSYFIGGANDLRAWKIYDLGPGATKNNLEYNVGSMKFLTSLEYRFDIINSFKGALFIDAGNIWDITSSDLTPNEGKFRGFDSVSDIAIGSGIGVRYDFNFLVIRLDAGFKTYEPYQLDGKRWFHNYNFGSAVYNLGINYPF